MSLSCCLNRMTRHHILQPSALAETGSTVEDGNCPRSDYDACCEVQVPGDRARRYRDGSSHWHRALSRVAGAVVPSAKHVRPMFRGKCRSETRFARKRNTFGPQAKHPMSSPVRQGVSDPGCTPGTRAPKNGPCGSAPRKRPWLAQPDLSERSLPGFFLAGRLRGWRVLAPSGTSERLCGGFGQK